MNRFIKEINQNRRLSICFALVFLALSYVIFSLALNSGSLWQYFGGFVSLGLALNLIKRAIFRR